MTNPTPNGQVPDALQPDTALLVARNCRETGSDPSCPFFARVQLMDAAYVLERLHTENALLKAGYDAARLEINHLRGVTKSTLLAQPVAWMVYLPSIDTQHLYYSQEDMGYVDDVTNHADAEVTPLYEMAAPKAEVAPAGEYPPSVAYTELPDFDTVEQRIYAGCRRFISRDMLEPIHGLIREAIDADRAARAPADSVLEDAARLERERICAAIKAEDDYCVDHGDYMLDSDDCIKIVRGEWVRPDFSVAAARKKGENHD